MRIIGMREGVTPGTGQASGSNPYIGCSQLSAQVFAGYMPPLYLMKMSEVDFLRAEGVLYGFDMGGDAGTFYNRGIDNAYLEPFQLMCSVLASIKFWKSRYPTFT